MNKYVKIVIVAFGILGCIYAVLFIFFGIRNYNVPTPSCDPGIPVNSRIMSMKFAEYNNEDFVCFNYDNPHAGMETRVCRLMGKEGDVIEIKNGVLYRNGENADKDLSLKFVYQVDNTTLRRLKKNEVIKEYDVLFSSSNINYVTIIKEIAEKQNVKLVMLIDPLHKVDEYISSVYNENWNKDNFGPLLIPEGKCFVIGDNRHNSEDSRFIGLIPVENITGKVLFK